MREYRRVRAVHGVPPSVFKRPPRSVMKPPPVPPVRATTVAARHGEPPKRPPAGSVPHPRRPRVVRSASGGYLGDLFRLFPDLPWAPRPRRTVMPRTLAARLWLRPPGNRG